jgi:tetratricopeptide (TPR) repeat protein
LSEVVWRLEDTRRGEILYALLLPFGARCVTSGAAFCGGSAERSLGLLASLLGRYDEAADHFERALLVNERMGGRPWVAYAEHDYARMLLARGGPGDRSAAFVRLHRAADAARTLGMIALCARLEPLMAERATEPADGAEAVLRSEGEYWTLAYGGSAARVRDARGLRLIALLLASPGREFPAVELAAWPTPVPLAGVDVQSFAKEAGLRTAVSTVGESSSDARARSEYRARLVRLREDAEEAERFNDPLRAARAREEIALLAEELAASERAGRRGPTASERARLSVTKAIRYAIRKVESAHPALGRLLADTVKTGTSCRYEPDPRSPVHWVL